MPLRDATPCPCMTVLPHIALPRRCPATELAKADGALTCCSVLVKIT